MPSKPKKSKEGTTPTSSPRSYSLQPTPGIEDIAKLLDSRFESFSKVFDQKNDSKFESFSKAFDQKLEAVSKQFDTKANLRFDTTANGPRGTLDNEFNHKSVKKQSEKKHDESKSERQRLSSSSDEGDDSDGAHLRLSNKKFLQNIQKNPVKLAKFVDHYQKVGSGVFKTKHVKRDSSFSDDFLEEIIPALHATTAFEDTSARSFQEVLVDVIGKGAAKRTFADVRDMQSVINRQRQKVAAASDGRISKRFCFWIEYEQFLTNIFIEQNLTAMNEYHQRYFDAVRDKSWDVNQGVMNFDLLSRLRAKYPLNMEKGKSKKKKKCKHHPGATSHTTDECKNPRGGKKT